MKERNSIQCHDCHALPGELHDLGCDVERCPYCGGQLISCGCSYDTDTIPNEDRIVWTGVWPGEEECVEWGWYSKRNPNGPGYIKCDKNDPEADPDLNRLYCDAMWDPSKKRYVLKE